MILTVAPKAQIATWCRAFQEQIPDFIPRAPQWRMTVGVAKMLAGEGGRHLTIEVPASVGRALFCLILDIVITREE